MSHEDTDNNVPRARGGGRGGRGGINSQSQRESPFNINAQPFYPAAVQYPNNGAYFPAVISTVSTYGSFTPVPAAQQMYNFSSPAPSSRLSQSAPRMGKTGRASMMPAKNSSLPTASAENAPASPASSSDSMIAQPGGADSMTARVRARTAQLQSENARGSTALIKSPLPAVSQKQKVKTESSSESTQLPPPSKNENQTAVVSVPDKRLDFSTPQEFVTIIVDRDEALQTFVIHKSLVSHYSPFFQKAFSSSFIEGTTQKMTLEDVSASDFGLFVHWLYMQTIECSDGSFPALLQLVRLFILADRFLVPLLPQYLLEDMEEVVLARDYKVERDTYADILRSAYSTQPADWRDNPLKKLVLLQATRMLVHTIGQDCGQKERTEVMGDMPEGMLADLMDAMMSGAPNTNDWKGLTFRAVKAQTTCLPEEAEDADKTQD